MKIKRITALLLVVATLFCFASCKKKDVKADPLRVNIASLSEDVGMKNNYIENAEHFVKVYAPLYGMSEADAKAFVSGSGNWGVYMLNTAVINKEETAYTFVNFKTGEITAQGMWICSESINGEVSVPGGTTSIDFPASIIVNLDKLDAKGLYTALAALQVTVTYYPTPADDNAEPAADSYKSLTAYNGIVVPENVAEKADNEISATRGSLEDGSDFIDAYRESSSNEFGLDEATFKAFTAKDSKWECYIFNVTLENKTDRSLTAYGLSADKNGENGLWVSGISLSGDEFGFEAGSAVEMVFAVLVNPDVTGGRVPDEIFKAMGLTLTYSTTPTESAGGSETLEVQKTVAVK